MVKYSFRDLSQRLMEAGDEPDTKGEIDLDDIAGSDTSQQVNPGPQSGGDPAAAEPSAGGQEALPAPPGGGGAMPNLDDDPGATADPKQIERGQSILSGLKSHPYSQSFQGNGKSMLNPVNLVNMDKDKLVGIKAKLDEMLSTRELRKKVGLYNDNKYQVLQNLKSFIEEIISKK